jgi:para-aminobenzoate synthetase component 1
MNMVEPVGLATADALSDIAYGAPPSCSRGIWERSRYEWRVSDGGDPAALLAAFLTDAGIAVHDLTRPVPPHHPIPGTVCGAALLISAAAGAAMIGVPAGPATPAPGVPDLVAIVYQHGPPRIGAPRQSPSPDGSPSLGAGGTAGGTVGGTARGGAPHRLARPVQPGQRAQPIEPAQRPQPAQRAGAADGGAVHRSAAGWRLGDWRASWTPARHAAAVSQVRAAIGRGDVYQVNLVGHASAGYTGDPLPALRRVAGLPGARYPGVMRGAGWAIACASPETLVEVVDGRVLTRPIKGTRPATALGRAELFASAKERAEHIMIVDLTRNDLSRLARTGSVRVDELFAIRRWCDLWQAESTVSAALAPGIGLAELLRAVCPGGSVTGAPKHAALAEIARHEPVGRGPSMGGLGWIGAGRLDLGLTIRTVAVDADRVHLWAGGGITWSSDPAAEVAEAAAKAGPIRAALTAG